MAEPSLQEIAVKVVEMARAAGAEQCDVVANRYEETSVTVRLGELEKIIEAGSHALGLRVINGGRTAVCSTTDFDDAALKAFAAETVELANISAADEYAGLPDPSEFASGRDPGLLLFDEQIAAMPTERKVEMARESEAAALGLDPRISNSDGGSLSTRSGETALANSHGFASSYPATSVSLAVEVMADDADGKKRNAYWYSVERSLARLMDPAEVGRIAARRAIDQLGAVKGKTQRVPVVFEPLMAAQLMGSVAGCLSGSALYRGATFLAGRVGEKVGSDLVTLVDEPLLPGRPGSRPFDGEGVATRRNVLFDRGEVKAFLFDVYTARRTNSRTTGSAARGIDSGPAPSTSNLVVQAGDSTPEEIIGGVQSGLYLTTLMGFGFNPTTGDFSRGAAGFWIENGQIAYPVTEVNISGRMDTMLASIDAVGNDLAWFGGAAAPTIRIAEMTVSGE